jgi:protein-S-isoprenylcysteine O-methyltransferase Ste14
MREYGRPLATAGLVLLCVLFAWANLSSWLSTGRPTGLGATILEVLSATLFLVRRQPLAVSGSALAWVAAPIGSFGMSLARPGGAGGLSHAIAEPIQLFGVGIAVVSLATLGRSFGLVAANRGVRIGGPYRLVRHPVYLGYVFTNVGYILENPKSLNIAVFGVAFLGQLVRIREEERVLGLDHSYRLYMSRVRSRLIPYVF